MKSAIRQGLAWIAWLAVLVSTACSHAPRESEEGRLRYQKAVAMFQERCKQSGEFIHRTADNVVGVFLMKIRPDDINYGENKEQQFRLDDPYGHDSGGETYIKTFFSGFYRNRSTPPAGYRYVEAVDPSNGQRYRYTGAIKAVGKKDPTSPYHQFELKRNPNFDLNNYAFVLDKVPAPAAAPRYGVTYDDISTHEEREYWIAGSSLKVIDLQTHEVMAERIGYMMDPGQGGKGGGRAPWLMATDYACPAFRGRPLVPPIQADQTRMFVVRILKPIQEK